MERRIAEVQLAVDLRDADSVKDVVEVNTLLHGLENEAKGDGGC
jgi:hypothetical protein